MKVEVWFREFVHPTYPVVRRSLELDNDKIALLIIDMQNHFIHPEGNFGKRGMDMDAARKTIQPTTKIANACRKAEIPVIYAKHTDRPHYCDHSNMFYELTYFRKQDIIPKITPRLIKEMGASAGLTIDPWSRHIVDELTPQADEIVIDSKHIFSCFYQTDLEFVLRQLRTETIFFTGVTTSICVETTIRDAFHRDFRCILVDDCTWERKKEMETASKEVISMNFGYLTSSQDVLKALRD
ncbi:isochorismatase family cysteine hydrolase [Chloroflexota bacterium]